MGLAPTTARLAGTRLEVRDDTRTAAGSDSNGPENAAAQPYKTPVAKVHASHDLLHRTPAAMKAVADILSPSPARRQ